MSFKGEAFFVIIVKELPAAKSLLRPENAPLRFSNCQIPIVVYALQLILSLIT